MYTKPFIDDLVRRLAPKLGATYHIEPEFGHFGYIDFPNGRRTFFSDNRFDLNTHAAVRVAQDKSMCSHMLRRFGYAVPEERTFWPAHAFPRAPERRNVEQAIDFARRIGWPVFVKPNDRSQGRAVARVWNEEEMREAAERVFEVSSVAIVQEPCVGRDYRLVMLDGRLLQAYERRPLRVVGDGESTIRELLDRRQREFRAAGRETTIRVDDAMKNHLARSGWRLSSVPARRKVVRLTEVANLSLGGSSVEVASLVHRTVKALGRSIARDLNLRFCGIDLMTKDVSKPLTSARGARGDGSYRILEVNVAPGLDHYALADERAQAKLVDRLYLKVLRAVARRGEGR